MTKMTDEQLVERYLGAFLAWAEKCSPNSAVADNARRAALAMVVEGAREEGRRRMSRC